MKRLSCRLQVMRRLGVAVCVALIPAFTTMAAAPHAAPASVHRQQIAVVAMNFYYAKPGKADEVYRWRLHASDVRAALGFPRGRVLRRLGKTGELADVVWECDYPSRQARARDYAAINASPEFQAVERHMETLLRRFRATSYGVAATPAAGH